MLNKLRTYLRRKKKGKVDNFPNQMLINYKTLGFCAWVYVDLLSFSMYIFSWGFRFSFSVFPVESPSWP